jgi:hypothetical protein
MLDSRVGGSLQEVPFSLLPKKQERIDQLLILETHRHVVLSHQQIAH